MELVAQGNGGNLDHLQAVANRTGGSGVIEFDIDTEFDIPGPWWLTGPDIKIGGAIKAGIGVLELTLKAIPGVHLDHGIEWTQHDGHGTLRIQVRNNPVPVILGAVVAAVLPWLIALGAFLLVVVIGWKLLKGAITSGGESLMVVILIVGLVIAFIASKGGGKVPGFG